MENLSVNHFVQAAANHSHGAIVMDKGGELGTSTRWRLSHSDATKQTNVQIMNAFKAALREEYGIFGEQAFDHVMTKRSSLQRSLRASDVKQIMAEATGRARFVSLGSEGARLMAVHPRYALTERSVQERSAIGEEFKNLSKCFMEGKALPPELMDLDARREEWNNVLQGAKNMDDLAPLVEKLLDASVRIIENGNHWRADLGDALPKSSSAHAAAGLGKMSDLSMDKQETSVEDRVRSGSAGKGMTLNPRALNPYILESLKTKGVEPGFIARHDWSVADTRSYMQTLNDASLRQEVYDLQKNGMDASHPPADFLSDPTALREAALGCGEKCGAYMSLLGEKVIGTALSNGNSSLHDVMMNHLTEAVFSYQREQGIMLAENGRIPTALIDQMIGHLGGEAIDGPLDKESLEGLTQELKTQAFSTVRKAIMSGSDVSGVHHESVSRFQERVIVKLDYNQSDRVSPHGALRKPLRCTQKQGHLYRGFCLHSINGTNASAVGEVLANDLTRLTGVKTQDLSLIRGQYENGRTKMMLEGKVAEGYQDFDTCLVDGRLVMPKDGQIKNLGAYKAGFVLMGDRDSIGSAGQNKGFVGDEFFAIDPGHSLEHSDIRLNEDFSLAGSSKDKFKNFSVFDDTSRMDKFNGILHMRQVHVEGSDLALFNQYENQFQHETDRKLRDSAMSRIQDMKQEFMERKNDILTTFESQLRMYDSLSSTYGNASVAEQAIETEANLSKLVSHTTMKSVHGKVDLRHMEVMHDQAEMQFRGHVQPGGGALVYESIGKANPEALQQALAALNGYVDGSNITVEQLSDSSQIRVTVPLGAEDNVLQQLNQLSEGKIMLHKHSSELSSRICANMEKLLSHRGLDGTGRHIAMDPGDGGVSWQMSQTATGGYTLSCSLAPGTSAQDVQQKINGFLGQRGGGALRFDDAGEHSAQVTLSANEVMNLYGQLDESAIISYRQL